MGTRLTCCFPDGTRPLRYRGPAIPERRRASQLLRRATSGAYLDIRHHHVARTEDYLEVRPARRAHRRRRHADVRRSHPRATGTMAILARACIEGCWRRRWWNGPGAASDRNEIAAEGRWFKGSPL